MVVTGCPSGMRSISDLMFSMVFIVRSSLSVRNIINYSDRSSRDFSCRGGSFAAGVRISTCSIEARRLTEPEKKRPRLSPGAILTRFRFWGVLLSCVSWWSKRWGPPSSFFGVTNRPHPTMNHYSWLSTPTRARDTGTVWSIPAPVRGRGRWWVRRRRFDDFGDPRRRWFSFRLLSCRAS